MSVTMAEWTALLEKEYLAEFIPAGGAAVKIAVVPNERTNALTETLNSCAQRHNCMTVHVSAENTKVHMIDKVFFNIAAQIDWDELAATWLRSQFQANGYYLSEDKPLNDLESIAAGRGARVVDVLAEASRWITHGVVQNYGMGKEFRTAMAMLCFAQINPQNVSPTDADFIKCWLRGEKTNLSALKRVQIYGRITRHNARLQLSSLANWLHQAGHAGLCVLLDASFVMQDIPPGQAPIRYTRNATLDFYEVLRQFIDDTDEMEHLLLITLTGVGMLEHPRKSVDNYTALKLRTADEVRDRDRSNPLNALVRLTAEN